MRRLCFSTDILPAAVAATLRIAGRLPPKTAPSQLGTNGPTTSYSSKNRHCWGWKTCNVLNTSTKTYLFQSILPLPYKSLQQPSLIRSCLSLIKATHFYCWLSDTEDDGGGLQRDIISRCRINFIKSGALWLRRGSIIRLEQYHFQGIQYLPHLTRRASYTNSAHFLLRPIILSWLIPLPLPAFFYTGFATLLLS